MSLVTCSNCVAEQFEDGYGARRKVSGVWDQVGDKCAAPQSRRDVQRTIDFVEGLQREHPDIDWHELLDKSYRSGRRLKAWEARYPEEPTRVKGFLRMCDEDSASISRSAKRYLIDTVLRGAKATIERIGEVRVQIDTKDPGKIRGLQKRQERLDQLRKHILLGIERIETAVKKIDTRGLLKGPAFWNVLRDTVALAEQLHLRVQAYGAGKDQVDEHKMAQAAKLASQSISAEEEETADPAAEAPTQPEGGEDVSAGPPPTTTTADAPKKNGEAVLENGMRVTGSPEAVDAFKNGGADMGHEPEPKAPKPVTRKPTAKKTHKSSAKK
ncbi:MAG: hypothetical protein A2Z11_03985 [Candidatus Woykebacteria bacterium RBG_16_43_9]|uniref:Uncharacterized protein n=1 Tax=Candidatus Woykebacteria bacterium RBG_16_43_9 TaxID=1802596 RepID=A0A1G1WE51_9BACT|nr:MAG: hypothetical protein A2Z11_03985 [Candidatus Woykebacteria bacterium RBG_16_43_9]